MELLAPVGTVENFKAALDAGADAVYVGAPGLNARNLARDLQLEEIGAMAKYCHDHGKRLYVAANSLVLEQELPKVVETLALLQTLEPDALIVQDLGLINLVQHYFPSLPLHASTLMLAHNADAVRTLAALGCKRVVLARELTVKEISAIAAQSEVQLEVFVHGAMCFSYSGLCLFSSYLGGKSGLRGRCVQPCRRRYQWQGKGGKGEGKGKGGSYLFSMNDLNGLEVIPELRRMGIASLKIEGRLRSAHYVSQVVRAYRLVLDADERGFGEAIKRADSLIDSAMGRTVSPGYFFTPRPKEAITPYYSGNIGLHLGRFKSVGRQDGGVCGMLKLKEPVAIGDRLRLHFESSGERLAFRLKEIRIENRIVRQADAGVSACLILPDEVENTRSGRIEAYKIDVGAESADSVDLNLPLDAVKRGIIKDKRLLARGIETIQARFRLPENKEYGRHAGVDLSGGRGKKADRPRKNAGSAVPLEWWLKTDSPAVVFGRLPFEPDRLLLTLDKVLIAQAGRIRQHFGRWVKNVIWALPPVILGNELGRMRTVVASLVRSGFKSFQIGHLSQISLFEKERVHLYGDYTINVMNDQAIRLIGRAGVEATQISIELDRRSLRDLVQGCQRRSVLPEGKEKAGGAGVRLGLTVYGAPALFTSRIAAGHFNYDRTLLSPKGESFFIRKKEGATQTMPCRAFSLLPYLKEMKDMGVGYAVVDITGLATDRKSLQELADRMTGKGRPPKLPTFNYLGKLE